MALPDDKIHRPTAPPSLQEFAVANGVAVGICLWVFLFQQPRLLVQAAVCAAIVILLEYRPMLACGGPWSRAFVLYVSMLLFLFIFGVLACWNQTVGENPAGSWLARLDGGFRFSFFGQLFGGVIGYPLVLLANSLLVWPRKVTRDGSLRP